MRLIRAMALLTVTACAGLPSLPDLPNLPGMRRAPAPVPVGSPPAPRAETTYAAQVARSELAGRELVRRLRARATGDEEAPAAAAARAIRTAKDRDFERCAEDYEAVAIEGGTLAGPAEGLVAVYMVPVPVGENDVPIGGFHRFTIDAATSEVIERTEMSAGCLALSLNPDGGAGGARVKSLLVNHQLTPYPLENHVYASTTSAVDLVVVTPRGTWRVVEGDIRAID